MANGVAVPPVRGPRFATRILLVHLTTVGLVIVLCAGVIAAVVVSRVSAEAESSSLAIARSVAEDPEVRSEVARYAATVHGPGVARGPGAAAPVAAAAGPGAVHGHGIGWRLSRDLVERRGGRLWIVDRGWPPGGEELGGPGGASATDGADGRSTDDLGGAVVAARIPEALESGDDTPPRTATPPHTAAQSGTAVQESEDA